jgi:hypothetical protein
LSTLFQSAARKRIAGHKRERASPAHKKPFKGDWMHEIKHNGFRILAQQGDKSVLNHAAMSRSGRSMVNTSPNSR